MRRLVVSLILFGIASAAHAQDWRCYDPQPGHPTAAEKVDFVKTVSELARSAESKYGIPAPAIAAMSIVESGYGWTRTALDANNDFGWKYYSPTAAGGRPSYTLGCQPAGDPNNHYVVFTNAADGMDFVASKLATLSIYRPAAAAYKQARTAGQASDTSAKAWLTAIAQHYNATPADYVNAVTKFMNDPFTPSDQVSASGNLYQLSTTAGAAPAAQANPNSHDDVLTKTRAWYASKLGTRQCDPSSNDFPRWSGFPIQRCVYVDTRVQVQTYMLNPTADQLAKWTVTACVDASARDLSGCAGIVSNYVVKASSGVFPVAGFIPEPSSSGGGKTNETDCFLFRDGVTVRTAKISNAPKARGTTCPEPDNDGTITWAGHYGRVASTTRTDYVNAGGTDPVGAEGSGDPRWVDTVRTAYQAAWNSDRNTLISATAKTLMAQAKK